MESKMRAIAMGLLLVSCSKDVYTQNKTLTQIPFWVPCEEVTLSSSPTRERKETVACTHADYCVECGMTISGTYTCGPGLYLDCPGKQLVLIKEQNSIRQCNYTYREILYHSAPWSKVTTEKQPLENCH
jgi:putative hemolysin